MDQIRERELIELSESLYPAGARHLPGMQLLAAQRESNGVDLLGIIEEDAENDRPRLPPPHMGWNRVYRKPGTVCSAVLMTARILFRSQLCHAGESHHRPVSLRRAVHRAAVQKDNFWRPVSPGTLSARAAAENFTEM